MAYKTSFLLGYELKQVGIDVNFSPVCDIYYDYGHSVIGDLLEIIQMLLKNYLNNIAKVLENLE